MSGICGRQRPLERLPRRVEIIDALTSPNQLKRVTADIRACIARGQHALGQAAGPVDVVTGERDLGLKDRRAAASARLVCREQALGASRCTLAVGHPRGATAA
jgi:hypothetical protein